MVSGPFANYVCATNRSEEPLRIDHDRSVAPSLKKKCRAFYCRPFGLESNAARGW